ncbi:MAG: hypothetical protein JST86_04480 [Bacteroidetes bacterium]|nr:hypothetical protein [Bacteroidota bacterium]
MLPKTLLTPVAAVLLSATSPLSKSLPSLKGNFKANERVITHKLGDKTISFKVIQYGETIHTCCINLHDNEATAVQAARDVLEMEGGLIVKIENGSKRMVSFPYKGVMYTFDPNRIFSMAGIKLTLKATGKVNPGVFAEVEKFANHLLELIPDTVSCVVALHNNTDGDYSVKSYQPGGKRTNDAKQVYANDWQDSDDIAFTTDDYIFTKMSSLGYNSILQDNVKVFKDGSLSVYYGEQNKRYINIETQFGKTNQYKEMLRKLFFALDEEKNPAAPVDVD